MGPNALCSRNFQNVKIKLDFVEIWSIYNHFDFTRNQILANSNGPKMSFMAILESWALNFGKFGTWKLLRLTKNQISEPLRFPKTSIFDHLNLPKFDFTKDRSGGKIIKVQQSHALISQFESFWSIGFWQVLIVSNGS